MSWASMYLCWFPLPSLLFSFFTPVMEFSVENESRFISFQQSCKGYFLQESVLKPMAAVNHSGKLVSWEHLATVKVPPCTHRGYCQPVSKLTNWEHLATLTSQQSWPAKSALSLLSVRSLYLTWSAPPSLPTPMWGLPLRTARSHSSKDR